VLEGDETGQELLEAALPVLAGLACPVSMLFMMPGMRAGSAGSGPTPAPAAGDRTAEIASLRQEVRQFRAEAGDLVPGPDGSPVLLELEAIEPCLYLDEVPGASERFARAVAESA